MTKTLRMADGKPRQVAPTTTVLFAKRILAASATIAEFMPSGYNASIGVDILLIVFLAEDNAEYLRDDEIIPAGGLSQRTTRRWIYELAQRGLLECRNDLVALTPAGYDTVNTLLEHIYAAQRRLDSPDE